MSCFGVVGVPYAEIRIGEGGVGENVVGVGMKLWNLHEASDGLHVGRNGCSEILGIGTHLLMDLS